MFRYDNSRLGRFMTPDPLAGSIRNPQSLNRYAYVLNNPTNLVDPLGLTHAPDHVVITEQSEFVTCFRAIVTVGVGERAEAVEREFCVFRLGFFGAEEDPAKLADLLERFGDQLTNTQQQRKDQGDQANYGACAKRADNRLQGALSRTVTFGGQGGAELFIGGLMVGVGVKIMIVGGATTGPFGVVGGGILTAGGFGFMYLGGHTIREGAELGIRASEQHKRDLDGCATQYPNAQH